MKRPSGLFEQYENKALAECARGSGCWPEQPHPCSLVPPWEPFERDDVSYWDCYYNDWEAAFEPSRVRRLLARDQVYDSDRPLLLPEVHYSPELAGVLVEQFVEDAETIPKAEQLLRTLPAMSRPVSFEIIGIGEKPRWDSDKLQAVVREQIRSDRDVDVEPAIIGWYDPMTLVQFVCQANDAPWLNQQISSLHPNSAVQVIDHDALEHDLVLWQAPVAVALSLDVGYWASLRTFTRLDPDPLGALIAAMETIERDQWAVLQILFEPVNYPFEMTLREAITDPYTGKILFRDVSERDLSRKFASPLFAVSIRLAASQLAVLERLLGWVDQFATGTQRFDPLHPDDDEAHRLLRVSMAERVTYRPGMLLSLDELVGLVHLPGEQVHSQRLRRIKRRTTAAAETTAEVGSVVLGENEHRGKRRIARIPAALRARHVYVAGASGTGKSTLLLNMILQDLRAGAGVGVLDPHGDLAKAVIRHMPSERVDEVIWFDPGDKAYPFALNVLEATDADERERIVEEIVMNLEQSAKGSWGPRLERILRFALHTVMEALPGATLCDVERMLTESAFRKKVTYKTMDPRSRTFWSEEFPNLPKNAIEPVLNKLGSYLHNSTVRNIVGQPKSGIDFDRLINGNGVLVANLASGILTDHVSDILGMFLVRKLVSAAFRRAAISEQNRRPFYLFVDEFQSFMNLSIGFDRILAEARKYKLVLAGLANQYVGQLSAPVKQAVFGNVGTMVVFRLGVDDATSVAKELGIFTAEEVLDLDVGEALVRAGTSRQVFNVVTPMAQNPNAADPRDQIIANTRMRYTSPRGQVEAKLRDEHSGDGASTKGNNTRKSKQSVKATPDQRDSPSIDPWEDDLLE